MLNYLKQLIGSVGLALLFAVSSIGVLFFQNINTSFGATIPLPVASFTTSLSTSISASDTSMSLVSITTDDGTTLTNGSVYGFVIDEGTSNEEFVTGTVSTSTLSVTGLTRGISTTTGTSSVSALQKAHRRGASVKITDHPVLTVLARILNGQETIPSVLSYATGVTPTGSSDLADKEYVLSVVSGGTVSFDQNIINGTAGETLASGDLVYLKETDGRWYLTDADTSATVNGVKLGITQGSGTIGGAISGGVLIGGRDATQSYTAGSVYYASNTAGDLATSSGTNEKIIGVGDASNKLVWGLYDRVTLTKDQTNALGGSQGIPNNSNKFVTQDNLSAAGTDQTQTTQNGTTELGEANATTKKNKLAQSFIPTDTKIRGIEFYKAASTGTFTGTATISIQADSGGNPSGSALATRTLTNAEWSGLASSSAHYISFASEYTSLTVGSTYWIVFETSTSDNSNHPNLGHNSAGGYASGSVKYNNSTDGWTAIATIDLYFKTFEGTTSQGVLTNSSGYIENAFYSTSELPISAFQQSISLEGTSTIIGSGSNYDGSVIYLYTGSTNEIQRFQRDSVSGMYFLTHTVSAASATPSGTVGIAQLGDYIYTFYDAGTDMASIRYLAADLTGEQAMTEPTVAESGTGNANQAWSDGTYLYFRTSADTNTAYTFSVSGTVISSVTTTSVSGATLGQSGVIFDGTNPYTISASGSTWTIVKCTTITCSSTSTSSKKVEAFSDADSSSKLIFSVDSTRLYIGTYYLVYDETAGISGRMMLIPVTKT